MKKILLIATGGTIASHAGANGLIPEIAAEGLLKCVPEVFEICAPSAIQIYNIDSTNVTPEHWVKLATTIREHYDEYDGFVFKTKEDAFHYGREHLYELDDEGDLRGDPDDYDIDVIAIPKAKVSRYTLRFSGL